MKILIAGDFCPQYRVASLFEKSDYGAVLSDIKNVIESVDYSLVNFECPVTTGVERAIEKHGPNLSCTKNGIKALKWAGFGCVTLANNHFYDYGDEGVNLTLQTCVENSIDVVGGGINLTDASAILYKEFNGKKIAIINCCEHEFSIATQNSGGSNPLNPIQQYYAIQKAKKYADYILVIVHGGHEHFQLPSPRMQETYRFFVDCGADAVINHHQHCYSGYEIYKGKPIFYGIGNFCFDEKGCNSGIWNEGYLVIVNFDDNVDFKILPYSQCDENPKVTLLPFNSYDRRLDQLNKVIQDEKQLSKQVDEYYASSEKQNGYIFEPLMNRVYTSLKYRGILPSFVTKYRKILAENFIGCESHRDKILSYLRKR